jgi:hypothetical protein
MTTTNHPHPAIDAWLDDADKVLAACGVARIGDTNELRDGAQRADVARRRALNAARNA